jgi:adenylate cyclase
MDRVRTQSLILLRYTAMMSLGEVARRVRAALADAGDDGDDAFRRELMLLASRMFVASGVVWGLVYVLAGEPAAGLIPLTYSVVSGASVGFYRLTHRFGVFRFTQLLLILLLPFALHFALGGFVGSSAVVLWSLLAPFGALLFDVPRRAQLWFGAFVALVAACGIVQPQLDVTTDLPRPLVSALFVANVGAVSGIAFTLMFVFVRERERALGLLRVEQQKSEGLLLNILPREIAELLKGGQRAIADHVDEASILFADMVGFTPLSASMTPIEMVQLLNGIVSQFDAMVVRHGAEKIRTIGDSYMAAAGVPRRRPDHAQAMASLALEMRDYLRTDPECRRRGVDFRIGINSGPLVAGVIGRDKFVYDLWGDSVNTASRMESHAEPGRIQITAATHHLIAAEFVCEPRGRLAIKGKGEMETWYLVGSRGPAPAPS